jgi:WD40 repeat protein
MWTPGGESIKAWLAHGRGGVSALAWSPQYQIIGSGGADGLVHIWDSATGACLATCKSATDKIRHLAWNVDGTRLAITASKKDPHIWVWEPWSGQQQATSIALGVPGVHWLGDGLCYATSNGNIRYIKATGNILDQQIGLNYTIKQTPMLLAGVSRNNLLATGTKDMLITVLRVGN